MKKYTNIIFVKYLMTIVSYIQKYENIIYIFSKKLFISILSKNIIYLIF